MMHWTLSPARTLTLDRPRLIFILNLTPDSFYDGGVIRSVDEAVAAVERAVADGADMVDIGGASTRPGAAAVPADEQVRRVVPAIAAIRGRLDIPISIDTTSAHVATAALDAGADVINDISAGTDDPRMFTLAAARGCGLILMHRLRRPVDDSYSDQYRQPPLYTSVMETVRGYLADRAGVAISAGIERDRIVVDPGLGFGKTVEQNLELLRRTGDVASLGFPVLSAVSRKSFVGRAAGLPGSMPADRLAGTIGLSVAHYVAGARLFRVHDVAPVAQALRAAAAALPD
jgi:dihydropteroate synthase